MTKFRKLTSDEENLCMKQRNRLEKQIEHLAIEKKYFVWMLYEGGLRKNFEQKEMEIESQLKETEKTLSEARFKVTQLESQLRDGVQSLKTQTG